MSGLIASPFTLWLMPRCGVGSQAWPQAEHCFSGGIFLEGACVELCWGDWAPWWEVIPYHAVMLQSATVERFGFRVKNTWVRKLVLHNLSEKLRLKHRKILLDPPNQNKWNKKWSIILSAGKMQSDPHSCLWLVEEWTCTISLKSWNYLLVNFRHTHMHGPKASLLGVSPAERGTVPSKALPNTFKATYSNSQELGRTQYPTARKWRNKWWCVHPKNYTTTIKYNKWSLHASFWINLTEITYITFWCK